MFIYEFDHKLNDVGHRWVFLAESLTEAKAKVEEYKQQIHFVDGVQFRIENLGPADKFCYIGPMRNF